MGSCSSRKNHDLEREVKEIHEKWRAQRLRQKRLVAKLEELAETNQQEVITLMAENANLEEHKNALDEELVEMHAKFHRLKSLIN